MAQLNIQNKNCQVDDALRTHFEEKIDGLSRVWPKVDEAILRVLCERGRFTAEVTLLSGGMITRAEERADNLHRAFDLTVEKLERQLDSHKKKLQTRKRRQNNRDDVAGTVIHPTDLTPIFGTTPEASGDGAHRNGAADAGNGVDEEHGDVMVRVKRFALKPMSAEEAALQMDLLGHEFFVFRDAQSNDVSVVYRRHSGGYGLIEPVAD